MSKDKNSKAEKKTPKSSAKSGWKTALSVIIGVVLALVIVSVTYCVVVIYLGTTGTLVRNIMLAPAAFATVATYFTAIPYAIYKLITK